MATHKQIVSAAKLFANAIASAEFSKTTPLKDMGERELLIYLRFLFLGYFGSTVAPEFSVRGGRVDFMIAGKAVEVAVRKRGDSSAKLLPGQNQSEIKKLLKHQGSALLLLFDLALPADQAKIDVDGYRDHPGVHGHTVKSPFSVAHIRYNSKMKASSAVYRIHAKKKV